ncbi:MAG: DNA glycosylase [Ignavibacteria bacterium]
MIFIINLRKYSWRELPTPYKILTAEFMLQRTKADQVEKVYVKFLQKYPDILSLSKARLQSVSKFTKNLGIHWRARNFVLASKYIIKNHSGEFPRKRNELLKIPGVGDYVAGAIQAVCFNNAEYVIDSNIARFINRFYGLELKGEIRRKKQVVEQARKIFKVKNQRKQLFAILDFTALICKPRNPTCNSCKLSSSCKYIPEIK